MSESAPGQITKREIIIFLNTLISFSNLRYGSNITSTPRNKIGPRSIPDIPTLYLM